MSTAKAPAVPNGRICEKVMACLNKYFIEILNKNCVCKKE